MAIRSLSQHLILVHKTRVDEKDKVTLI